MATVLKPKKKKIKKTKIKENDLQVVEDDDVEQDFANETLDELVNEIGTINIEDTKETSKENIAPSLLHKDTLVYKAATSEVNKIISHDCIIASEHDNSTIINTEKSETQENVSKNLNLTEIVEEINATANATLKYEDDLNAAEPTAPPVDVTIGNILQSTFTANIVEYPDIKPLEHMESENKHQVQNGNLYLARSLTVEMPKIAFTDNELNDFYYCLDLDNVKPFELEFIQNSLMDAHESDPFYLAVQKYYDLQCKLSMNLHDAKKYRKDATETQKSIWIKKLETKTFLGHCGDNYEVSETVTYNITKVDIKNYEAASAAIGRLYDHICFSYITNLILAKEAKIKIDQIISSLLADIRSRSPPSDEIVLRPLLESNVVHNVAQLRRSLTILFNFARKIKPNKQFDSELKSWIRQIVSIHLRFATKEDHWFLLFNILRCPCGVGAWAAEFVQIPMGSIVESKNFPTQKSELPLSINSAEINNCIVMLKVLLFPVQHRAKYLKAFNQFHKEITDPVQDERWILIDSDGEDSLTPTGECAGLKESDLIALLNQIPFERLFASSLNLEKFLEDYIIEADKITGLHMLKIIAFFNTLIKIFGEGMLTYNTERYKHLAKRLGRLIRHTLQYFSDYYEIFNQNNLTKEPTTSARIEIEADALLVKACSYIYRGRNLATWQYFSSLSFSTLKKEALWQIFYYLNVGFPTEFPASTENINECLQASDFWAKFNVANADSSAEDMYYLLQAFFEMANERDKRKDEEFIKRICAHIFQIGFLNKDTREICFKTARDMLVNLTLTNENLICFLLMQTKQHFDDTENVSFLFKSLPLEIWKPDMDSFEILSNWLLNYDYKSKENLLSRIIISHINWMFDCDGRLFMPHNIHVRMACLLTEALTKHAPEVIGLSGLSESVRQVSSFLDFTQATKEHFTEWCWCMVSVLRLHLMDQNVEAVKHTLQNPVEKLSFVPELERLDKINQGVTEMRPLALYVALLASLHGHSVPLICQKGFELMQQMLNDHRYAAVIRCIELIVPIFLETPDTLANCPSFHAVLNALLNADNTYLKMAKGIIYPNTAGPVLELFDNMIHHQITTYSNYGLPTPLNLINVWLNCFTALPNWQNTSVVYLLEKVLRVAYQFPDARCQAVEFFFNYFKNCGDWKGQNKLSTIKTFFSGNQSPIPALSPSNGWLALILLEIEFKLVDSQFWLELIQQLAATNEKQLGDVLKKTTSMKKLASFQPNMLVIYKYANIIANMEPVHPTLPILSQKFFELYLTRVPYQDNEEHLQLVYGVSDKFYEHNIPLMKKIKNNLQACKNFYDEEAIKRASDEGLSHVYRSCSSLMKSFALWLEETTINKIPKDGPNFPPQFNNQKLCEIMNGNTAHWTEYIYLPEIRKEQRQQADKWAVKCHRTEIQKRQLTPIKPKVKTTATERIKHHLHSYDKRLKAPEFLPTDFNLPQKIDNTTMKIVKQKLSLLNRCANKFHYKFSEVNSLNGNYLDAIKALYKMVPYEEVKLKSCNSLLFNRKCTNPASITTIIQQIRKDEAVERKILDNREKHEKLIDELIKINIDDFTDALGHLTAVVRLLLAPPTNPAEKQKDILIFGIDLFYEIIENMNETSMKFQPAYDFYHHILCELGIFLHEDQEKQGLNILQLTFKRPDLLTVLSGVFVPYRTRPDYFLKMYKYLVESHMKNCDSKVLFVLLSKFDMFTWLAAFQPKLIDIHNLLQLVLFGLECWSHKESTLLQDLFRRHLIHIFNYEFPAHFTEVLQMVFQRISDRKIMPIVLFDLINALLGRYNCEIGGFDMSAKQIENIASDFATKQNILTLKTATDTVHIMAAHFRNERLKHGLHGLYPKHKDYCLPIAFWFSCFSHTIVYSAFCTYQALLADQISDIVFGAIIEMYSPWITPYTEQTMTEPTAKWIHQLMENGKVLYPFSEKHVNTSRIMMSSFVGTLNFLLTCLPDSDTILKHVFAWYIHHFTLPGLESYIFDPVHEGLSTLPWERYKPQSDYIEMLHESLTKFIPQAHAMFAQIFLRINWKSWFSDQFVSSPTSIQHFIINHLFSIFIKLSFEPSIHKNINTSKILEDTFQYPWEWVNYTELDNLLTWFLHSVEPVIILNLPSTTNYTDRAVLQLIRKAASMTPDTELAQQNSKNDAAKRILYTRSIVRMLRLCVSKYRMIITTREGQLSFHYANQELLCSLDRCINLLAPVHTLTERGCEALHLLIEIINPMQCQSEESSSLCVQAMIDWQQKCTAGNLIMCNTISAIGHMKAFIFSIYPLIEYSIVNYFRTSEESQDWHQPTWASLLILMSMSLDKLELTPIITGGHFLTLHVFILHRIEKMGNLGDKITFLQDVIQLVENLKTDPMTEPRMALVWGVIISRSCRVLTLTGNVKKPLMLMAHSLQVLSTQSEGWSDNLLGAFGLKKETITMRRKVLTRALACVIFSLFPDTRAMRPNEEYNSALRELSILLANKKFTDVKSLIVKVVGIIQENKVPVLRDVPLLVCRIISIFYESSFLGTVPEIWDIEFP